MYVFVHPWSTYPLKTPRTKLSMKKDPKIKKNAVNVWKIKNI